jgi:hypothetical protein
MERNGMRKFQIFLVSALLLTGCSSLTLNIPKPESKYTPAIQSAFSVSDPQKRTDALTEICSKPDLNEKEQAYILSCLEKIRKGYHINGVIHFRQISGPEVTQVLLTLVDNPASTNKIQSEISELLPSLKLSDSEKNRIAKKLHE